MKFDPWFFPMFRLVASLSLFLAVGLAIADEPPTVVDEGRLRADLARLLAELDSDRFEVRTHAAERLDEWVAKPELGSFLGAEFRRVLVRPDVSFEVRWRLRRWSRRLPDPPVGPVGEAPPEELDRLARQLDDDSYAVRVGATKRLDWLLGNPKLVCPVMIRLKQRLASITPGAEAHQQLEAAWQRARGAWLLNDAASEKLPAVSDEQINRWLDALTRPVSPDAVQRHSQAAAERELLDLLVRDEYLPRLIPLLNARLARDPGINAAARLQSLLDWTKPELVAEYWQGRHQLGQQHLLVGVPSLSPGATNPSHFDRADEREAHCVSGNSLSPGNYPVGEAFPHPRQENAFFQLVNLPTPRRRMAYLYFVQTSESDRLAAISRRTLNRVLTDRRVLSEPELVMLAELDPVEVSRFAGKYFLLLDDGPLAAIGPRRLGGRSSRFGIICALLAADGTKDALPGLVNAIEKNIFLPPTSLAPYRLPALAALSIAARDPWPEVDPWLARQIAKSEQLVEGRPAAAELGATAAAILLGRHGQKPAPFNLQPVGDPVLKRLRLEGYRFDDEASRKKVQQWWAEKED